MRKHFQKLLRFYPQLPGSAQPAAVIPGLHACISPIPCAVWNARPAEAVHGASGFLKEGDALVWASRGGKTDELFFILDICRTKKVTVIGVTENLSSPLAAKSHIVLPMKVTSETDRYNSQGTSSFIALAAVFDALQTAVIEETGYQNEQFALIHPGGAVGKRLNNRNI